MQIIRNAYQSQEEILNFDTSKITYNPVKNQAISMLKDIFIKLKV